MSYILDALKKAEAERGQGVASAAYPSHAAISTAPSNSTSAWRAPWPWLALAATASAVAALALLRPLPASTVTVNAAPAKPAASTPPVTLAQTPAAPRENTRQKEEPAEKQAKQKIPKKTVVDSPPPAPSEQSKSHDNVMPTLRDLPEHMQREIPSLSIGGYIYSNNKADRSVLINNKLLREGDEIVPDFTIEKMMQNGMVLNYKGYRYRTPY